MRQAGGIHAQLFQFSTERPSQQKARSADMHLDEHRDRLAAHRARLALSREHIGAVSARELVPAGYCDARAGWLGAVPGVSALRQASQNLGKYVQSTLKICVYSPFFPPGASSERVRAGAI